MQLQILDDRGNFINFNNQHWAIVRKREKITKEFLKKIKLRKKGLYERTQKQKDAFQLVLEKRQINRQNRLLAKEQEKEEEKEKEKEKVLAKAISIKKKQIKKN